MSSEMTDEEKAFLMSDELFEVWKRCDMPLTQVTFGKAIYPLITSQKAIWEKEALRPIPMVNGLTCPACGHAALMLGDGGFITCCIEDCPNPDYAAAIAQLSTEDVKES